VGQIKKKPKSVSIRKRLRNMMIILALALFSAMAYFFYLSVGDRAHNRSIDWIYAALQEINASIDADYNNALLLSGQMTPQGIIGEQFDRLLAGSDNPYVRYSVTNQLNRSMVASTSSNNSVRNCMYYDVAWGEPLFSLYRVRDAFSLSDCRDVASIDNITFHAFHSTSANALRDTVLSVSRKTTFSNGGDYLIYIEYKNSLSQKLLEISTMLRSECEYLFLDSTGNILYAESGKAEKPSIGSGGVLQYKIRDSGQQGLIISAGDRIGAMLSSSIGYQSAMLMPARDYNREVYRWRLYIIGILLPGVLLVMVAISMFSRLLYAPVTQLAKESAKLEQGDLDSTLSQSGVAEFDLLFNRFNGMKAQIKNLLEREKKSAEEKHSLEVEMIYFQINPHFLLNAVHSINWLARMHGQKDIMAFSKGLNYILAYSLYRVDRQATMRSELRMIEAYLELQNMRYHFRYEIQAEDGPWLSVGTPRLFLQPLVENSILYGPDEQSAIELRVFYAPEQNAVVITLRDNGRGMNAATLQAFQEPLSYGTEIARGNGIGIRYVRYVLDDFYGENYIFSVNSEVDHGTKITMMIPAVPGAPLRMPGG
jgi:two-component system sensor histidine kinase YesM